MAQRVKVQIKNLPEFTATLKRYAGYSKKTHAEICNKKALFVARGALRETEKATKAEIKQQLMAPSDKDPSAPIAALLVNAKRAAQGLPGLYGDQMKLAIEEEIKSRRIASLKSGWVWSIRKLSSIVGGSSSDRGAVAVGAPKGYAVPARDSVWSVKTIIANAMMAKWDNREGALKKAKPALERALAKEEASMRDYIEKKQRETADRAGIKHN